MRTVWRRYDRSDRSPACDQSVQWGGSSIAATPVVALDDLSLAIEEAPPTITAIVGESGSGKTTLARLILGLDRADQRRGPLSRG